MPNYKDFISTLNEATDYRAEAEHSVKQFDKGDISDEKLFKTKVLNKLKEKRNKSKSKKIKDQLIKIINALEKEIK